MDSKNIYISYQHYSNYIKWEMHGDSEWIYVGTDGELKKEKVIELINNFFTDSDLNFIPDRHNSSVIDKSMALEKIVNAIEESDPALASTDFRKIMEFGKIGIVRKGQRKE